jgi:hypothetical protein
MTEDNTIKIYQSIINPDYTIHIVYKENAGYKDIKDSLDSIKSVGALWIGTTNIFIDGESIIDNNIDQDQILALEAHEIAHSLLNHAAGMDEQSEKEADLFAITLLDMDGHYRASDYLKQRLQTNYGINYSEFEEMFESDFEDDWKIIDAEMFGEIAEEPNL